MNETRQVAAQVVADDPDAARAALREWATKYGARCTHSTCREAAALFEALDAAQAIERSN